MGCFCFCSGLSLRGVIRRVLQTVLPLTFTTGTRRCSCQWWFWNVYTGKMCIPSIQNGLNEHSRIQGERTAWRIHCIYRNGTATFNLRGMSPSCVKSLVSMSAELSEEWLASASGVCDPSRLRSQEHAASRRAVYSCGWQLSCSQLCLTDVTCRNHAFYANSPEVP